MVKKDEDGEDGIKKLKMVKMRVKKLKMVKMFVGLRWGVVFGG